MASRRDLSRLKSEKHNAVTVTSLDGFMGAMRPLMEVAMVGAAAAGASQPVQEMMNALEKLPNRGKTPIVAVADVEGGDKPKMTVQWTVAKETLEDVGFLVQKIMTIVGNQGSMAPPP